MKKILSLIGAFAIVGISTTQVVACAALDIINKIKNKTFTIPVGSGKDVTSDITKKAINKELQHQNPSLTSNDLQTLTYSGKPLIWLQSVNITVTSTKDFQTAWTTIKVTLDESLAEFLQQLKHLTSDQLTFYTLNFVKNPDGNYYASNYHNAGLIQESIGDSLPNQGAFIDGLSFTRQVKVGTTSNIEVYYNGTDQNMKLPIKLLKF